MIKPPDHITSGYEIVPAVLDQQEIADVGVTLQDQGIERSRAGARHLMRHSVVQQLAHDPRLVALACRFLGPSAIPFRATLFDKSPANNWLGVCHQDTALPLPDVVMFRDGVRGPSRPESPTPTLRLPRYHASLLFDCTSTIQAQITDHVRVLAGTHARGMMSDAEVAQLAREVHAVDCVCPAGRVVAMRPLLVHASSKAETDRRRRVLHIEYADALALSDGLELAVA